MAWTAPRTWVAGEKITAATMNLHIRDNLRHLGLQSGFTNPSMVNSWSNFLGGYVIARYQKIGQVVWVQGLIKSGTPNATAFSLPVGYRPLKRRLFTQWADNGQCRMDVFATGEIQVGFYQNGGTNAYVSITASFIAEQ